MRNEINRERRYKMKQEITIPRKETKQERAARENHKNDRWDFGKHARWWLSFVDGVNGDFR